METEFDECKGGVEEEKNESFHMHDAWGKGGGGGRQRVGSGREHCFKIQHRKGERFGSTL